MIAKRNYLITVPIDGFRNTGFSPSEKQKLDNPNIKTFQNAIALTAKWLEMMWQHMFDKTTVLVNACGGYMLLDNAVKILATVESDTLTFPEIFDDEVITISRWPNAPHWYLSSNKNRIFDPPKCNTIDMARIIAKRYVDDSAIVVKER